MAQKKHTSTATNSVDSKVEIERTSTQSTSLSDSEQNFLLSQFSALREEVLKRIEIQHQLILGAMLAVGTVLTVSTQGSPPATLLLYPFLAMFLTLAWSQNDYRVREITTYLANNEQLFLANPSLLGWEHTRTSSRLWIFGSRKVAAARGVFVGSQLLTILLFLLKLRASAQFITQDDAILLAGSVIATAATLLIIGFPSRRRERTAEK